MTFFDNVTVLGELESVSVVFLVSLRKYLNTNVNLLQCYIVTAVTLLQNPTQD